MLPQLSDKKTDNGLPILDASFNTQTPKKQSPSPTIPQKSSGGLPVIDSSYNQFVKKKVGGSESVDISLTQSESPSGLPERVTPTSFLSNDIEQSQFFSAPEVPAFDPRSLAEPTTPSVQPSISDEDRQVEREKILTDPNALSAYAKDRVNKLKSDIRQLENVDLEKFAQYNVTSVPGAMPIKSFAPGAEKVTADILEKKKYLEDFQRALSNQAAYAVASTEDLSSVDDVKLKEIGTKYLKTMNDTGVASDEEILRTIDDIGANKTDIDRTSQNINYKLYKTGADVVAKYYADAADRISVEAQPKLRELAGLFNQQGKTEEVPGAVQGQIDTLMQDPQVKAYLDAERNAATYVKKSNDAINEFPQVKRQAMRQQLNDAFFAMTAAKQSASKDIGSIGNAIGNWIFGEEATNEDVPALSKATGIPEDQVSEIVKSNIKGWFGEAKEAGVRIPGALIGLAQSTDETLAKAVMGTKRFLNTENVETENALLSDRVQDYNLKAQKAKLFDDAGKLNFNPYSVFNTMGGGIGQTAVYAAPSLLTGGLASSITGIEKVGKLISMATTTGTGFVGSYEDAFKEARQYTDDEDIMRSYATKVGLVNGLSEIFLEPADIAKKLAIGAPRGKNAFDAFQKMYKDKGAGAAMAQGLKEFGKVVGTENVEELAALLGETKFKESDLGVQTSPGDFINQAIETAVTTTLTTLPLGVGAGINGNRDVSSIRKQALFEAGNEPDLYKTKLKSLLDNGTIDQRHYNDRVAVVNTMSGIVAGINESETRTGKPLSYDEKSNLAAQQFRIDLNNKRLKSQGILEAEKPIIEEDTKQAIEAQKIILEDAEPEALVSEVPFNEKEQSAIEGLQGKDFSNSAVKPYTDVIQNPDASIEDKKEALKGLSDQLTAKGTEVTVGEALGKEADLIYDLGYEPVVESEAIQAVTESGKSGVQLADADIIPAYKKVEPFVIGEAARSSVNSVMEGMNNAEYINENNLNDAANNLYDLLDKYGDNKSFSNLVEPLIRKIESYEFRTKTEAGTVTEKRPVQVVRDTAKKDFDKRPILEQLSSGNATIQKPDGNQFEGRLLVRDGKYELLDQEGNTVASLGEKAINDRDVSIPSPEEVDNFVTLDENDNVSAITVKTRNGNLVTFSGFKNPDVPLDLAIQMSANVISVPNEVFDTAYEEVQRKVYKEVLASEPQRQPDDVSSEQTVPATGELTPKEKLASEKSLLSYRAKYPKATQEEYQANRVSGVQKSEELKKREKATKEKGVFKTAETAERKEEAAPVVQPAEETKSPKKRKEKLTSIKDVENELRNLFAMDSLTKNKQEPELPLINEKGEINNEQLKKSADSIEAGTAVFERFSPQEQRGFAEGGRANVEASILLAANERAGGQNNATPEAQENSIEQYAKKAGIWVDNTTINLTKEHGEPIASGEEAIVWGDEKNGRVIKTQDTFQYDNLQQKLDGITLHNAYFPEATLRVIGFGRNANGDFQVIVEQPFVQGEKLTKSEIDSYLIKLGFTENENGHFSNNDTIIEDVHTGNAIKTLDGNIVVIDPIMRLNTPEQGYGGTRKVGNGINSSQDKISTIPVGGQNNTIEQYLEKARTVLSQLYPDATITTYDSAEEYYDKEGRPVGSAGVFHPQEQRLALNLELIAEHGAENTIFHEVIHPIVNEVILSKEGALDDVFEQLKELKDVPGMEAVWEHIQAYAGRGINIQKVEGITEFLTQVADGRIDLANIPEKSSSKIIDLINKIFEALGISLRVSTATDLKRLSEAIKTSFDNADATAVKELVGRRSVSAETKSMDALSVVEQEKQIKDIISRSEGIPQDQLKAAIKKYTGWSDEKIDGFFIIPKADSKKGTTDRAILASMMGATNLSERTKSEIKKRGLKSKTHSQEEARSVATKIIDDYGIDDSVSMAELGKFHGDVNSMIFAVSIDEIYDQEQRASTAEERISAAEKYADVALRYQDAAESGGRFISAIYDFFKKSPAGLVLKIEKEFARKRDDYFKGREGDMKDAFDEFINTTEGREIFEEATKKSSQQKKKIFTKEGETKIRNFFDKLKINTKTTTGSYLVPPQIFNAAIDIVKEAVVAGVTIGRAIEAGVDYINDNHKAAWKINEFKKDIRAGFKRQDVKREITEEDRQRILKKWDKKLRGLDMDAKNKLLNRAFIELMDNGALELDQFRQMYAEAIGLPQMTPELSKKLGDLANAINEPGKLKEDIRKNPTEKKIKEDYPNAIKAAETASRELNELIGKERWWVDTLATVMRLNTLGIISLVGNIVYNVAALPVRFSVNLTSTGLDYLLSGVQITSDKLFATSYFKPHQISSPFKIQAAWFRGFKVGGIKSVEQLVSGVSNRDYFQKEIQQNLRPFSAGKNLWAAMTGKKKMSANSIANAFIESFPTGGMSANFTARMLNVGDKAFRFGPEFAKAEELANKKGLKGIDKEVFMLFPDEESEKIIRDHGERMTFQQKNIVTKALDAVGNAVSGIVSEHGLESKALYGIGKTLGYAMQPFLNTPLNVFNEFIHYAFPPLSIYKATKAAIKGDSKTANSYISKAIVGWAIQSAATQLLLSGLLVAGGDDDEEQKERKGIQTYHRQGQLNFTGLKRLLSGGDPAGQDGDVFIDLKYWGFIGMIFLAKADQYRKTSKEEVQQQNFAMDMIGMFPSAVQTGLTEGVFSGTSSLLNAYSMGGGYVDSWLLAMANTAENSFAPAWLRSLSLSSDSYMRDAKGANLPETAFNQIKQRFFSGQDLPIRRNIWGDKIESTPKNQNAFVYYMFGINKKTELDKSKFGYALYDLYNQSKDHNLFPPVLKREVNKQKLNPQQYEQLQELVGSHRKQLVGAFISTREFESLKEKGVGEVSKRLQSIYGTGRDIGVSEFLSLYPEFQKK